MQRLGGIGHSCYPTVQSESMPDLSILKVETHPDDGRREVVRGRKLEDAAHHAMHGASLAAELREKRSERGGVALGEGGFEGGRHGKG